jgi:exodeoxyribonuclease V alpha subunit
MSIYPERLNYYVDGGAVTRPQFSAVATLLSLVNGGVVPPIVNDLVWLSFALALNASEGGHTCIDLNEIDRWYPDDLESGALTWPPSSEWLQAVSEHVDLVATPSTVTNHPRRPFVLDGSRLYVLRSFEEERSIADWINSAAGSRLKVLLGGPGSGKTTAVAKQLVARFADANDRDLLVAMAAPTGKAADRMRQAIEARLLSAKASPEVIARVQESPSITIHRLLGYSPVRRTGRFQYNHENPLPYDLVIIDEASMLSLSLMHRLIDALHPTAELFLVGDPEQLASVDAGTVLADISLAAKKEGTDLYRCTERLTSQYRYAVGSPIEQVVKAVQSGDADQVIDLLRSHRNSEGVVSWIDPSSKAQEDLDAFENVGLEVKRHALKVVELAGSSQYEEALETLGQLQLLCASRVGQLGIAGWNRTVNKWIGTATRKQWFVGRPVLITKNDHGNNLYNGDVGVVCSDKNGEVRVVFDGLVAPREFPTVRLPEVETVHALTIHKSQGSEYQHAIVVLPTGRSRLLTRELLYTGVSRAREQLTIVASESALRTAVNTVVIRASGLADRL